MATTCNVNHMRCLLMAVLVLATTAATATPDAVGTAPRAAAAAAAAAAAVPPLVANASMVPHASRPLMGRCNSERQMVMCSHIADMPQRQACCSLYVPVPASPSNMRLALDPRAAAQAEVMAMISATGRADLRHHPGPFEQIGAECFVPVVLPAIPDSRDEGDVEVTTQYVPQLTPTIIRQVKATAFKELPASHRKQVQRLQWVSAASGFVHPAAMPGPSELVWMQHRLQARQQPQHAARLSLLTGGGVRPKVYTNPDTGRTWAPPVDCPATGYAGPYAVAEVAIDWGGVDAKGPHGACSHAYDPEAPRRMCGHVSSVELDAVMAYKQALAWWATEDDRHARQSLTILQAWTGNSSTWGLRHRNGPLQAAWHVASMARALELLRTQAPPGLIPEFLAWVDAELMPQMDFFVDDENGLGQLHSNFHSAIVDAMTAVAVLADDRARWDKARGLFHATVARYLRWGKGAFAEGHVLGECTETQRDIFHSQMGLAGLLQAAEMAFQQDEDWYSSNEHALAAAVELHARLVRAALARPGDDEAMLPQGFAFFDRMPKPPRGTFWRFDLDRQIWAAHSSKTGARVRDKPDDGLKYLVGTDYLPIWEMAYNHYSGRLGLNMPETAALLHRMWPEWYELYFGLGSLTHANSAAHLWVPGIKGGFKQC